MTPNGEAHNSDAVLGAFFSRIQSTTKYFSELYLVLGQVTASLNSVFSLKSCVRRPCCVSERGKRGAHHTPALQMRIHLLFFPRTTFGGWGGAGIFISALIQKNLREDEALPVLR